MGMSLPDVTPRRADLAAAAAAAAAPDDPWCVEPAGSNAVNTNMTKHCQLIIYTQNTL